MTQIQAYEDLANAIVYKAVREYQHALISLHQNPNNEHAQSRIREVNRFFEADWFHELTAIDSGYLKRVARKQLEDRDWKRFYIGYDD